MHRHRYDPTSEGSDFRVVAPASANALNELGEHWRGNAPNNIAGRILYLDHTWGAEVETDLKNVPNLQGPDY